MDEKKIKIKHLTEKFYQGLTSVDEEQTLIDYYNSEDATEENPTDCQLFKALAESTHKDEVALDFEERMSRYIDMLSSKAKQRRNKWQRIASVAACATLLSGIGLYIHKTSSTNPHEVTDPEIAYLQTEKALLLVSNKLNKVDDQMAKVNHIFDNLNDDQK